MSARFRFPRIFRRTYGYNALPNPPLPLNQRDAGVNAPNGLPSRGNTSAPGVNGGGSTLAGSRRVIGGDSASDGRSYLGVTERVQLESQPAPNRIDRRTMALNAGAIACSAEPVGMGGWPYDGSGLYIPHQPIPRKPQTPVVFVRTIDTGVTIPSVGIGNPVR